MSNAPAFIYSEARVAESLGISRTEVRHYRSSELMPGVDWKKERGEILLSDKGLERLSGLCGQALPAGFVQTLQKKNGGPKKMRVSQIPPNPRMVLAQDDDSDCHLVYVGNNTTFVVGDEIEVVPHSIQKGIWTHLGQPPRDRRRLPR